jgi:hemoglobin
VTLRRVLVSLTAVLVIGVAGLRARADAATLFDTLGGEPVLRTTVDRFADIVEADPRIDFTFADTDMAKFKQLLFEQLCELTKGPCHYSGRDMHTAHAKLKITTAEFNALAEDLYLAMGRAGVPYRQQNRVMALLAPMKRDIVKPPSATPDGSSP